MGHLRAWGADGGLGIGLGVQMGNMPWHGEAAGSGSRTAPEPTTSGLAVRRKLGKDKWTRMVPLQNCSFHTFTHRDTIRSMNDYKTGDNVLHWSDGS